MNDNLFVIRFRILKQNWGWQKYGSVLLPRQKKQKIESVLWEINIDIYIYNIFFTL